MKTEIHWIGPYTIIPQNGVDSILNDENQLSGSGVYLWTIEGKGRFYINYVGITQRGLFQRQQEHIQNMYSGKSIIYSPDEFRPGKKEVLYDPKDGFKYFIMNYKRLSIVLDVLMKKFRIFFALVNEENTFLKRVETAIIKSCQETGGDTADFLDNSGWSKIIPKEELFAVNMGDVAKFKIVGLKNSMMV